MRNRIRLLVIALLAVLSLAACGNEGSGTATVNMKQLQQAMSSLCSQSFLWPPAATRAAAPPPST